MRSACTADFHLPGTERTFLFADLDIHRQLPSTRNNQLPRLNLSNLFILHTHHKHYCTTPRSPFLVCYFSCAVTGFRYRIIKAVSHCDCFFVTDSIYWFNNTQQDHVLPHSHQAIPFPLFLGQSRPYLSWVSKYMRNIQSSKIEIKPVSS